MQSADVGWTILYLSFELAQRYIQLKLASTHIHKPSPIALPYWHNLGAVLPTLGSSIHANLTDSREA
ncbi:hypothetical protein BCEP4_1980008 [Burkholderia cepacia]|nr:hypothetical protein BCEP4_1980008 [Burkholderia cepacia]